jgi:hypothetical protein
MLMTAIVIGFLALAVGSFLLLRRFRDRAMISLASELGFEYLNRTVPTTFPKEDQPFSQIRSVWDVIHGQEKGVEVVVFDGIHGEGRGVYRTFIAVQTPKDPFPRDEARLGNTLQSSGWTVLCGEQKGFNLIPWSISTRRIKDHLRNLKL